MSFLDRAEKSLRAWRRANLTQSVTYRAVDGLTFDAIPATQGTTTIETLDGPANLIGDHVDWIVERADIGQLEPMPGDRLYVAIDVDGGSLYRVYEATAVAGSNVWSPHGRDGLSVRIHTKFVDIHEGFSDAELFNYGGG